MDKYYKKLSLFLVRNHKINKNDSELYEYAIKVVVHGIINIVVTVIVGLLFEMLKECLCVFFVFFILRKFTGGLHSNKYIYCLISSVVLMILSLFIIKYFEQNHYHIIFLSLVTIFTILIWILAPIDNHNKLLSATEKNIYKIISRILTTFFYIISIYFLLNEFKFCYSFGFGIILTSLLLIIEVISRYLKSFNYSKKRRRIVK